MAIVGESFYLYGPPGSGKSTLGRHLAEALKLPYIDLDDEIETTAGESVAGIFRAEGEAVFRKMEGEALKRASTRQPAVVALGGGTLLRQDNRSLAEGSGQILLLTAAVETLVARLSGDVSQRPLLEGNAEGKLRALLTERERHYASFPKKLDTGEMSVEKSLWEAQLSLGAFHLSGMGPGYEVRVRSDGLETLGAALRLRGLKGPVAIVSDETVGNLYAERAEITLVDSGFRAKTSLVPPGESSKNMVTVAQLWDEFLEAGLDRDSTVVALGGGVVGDLAGFAAATFLRGIAWVAVPTTLLAMVDASLGAKTGVDLPQGKNLVGAFYPPKMVRVDPDILATLPEVEFRSGMAEVIKHSVIGDPLLFERIGEGWPDSQEDWPALVRRSMAVKIGVLEEDPYERGRRAALNFGHTVGHAVELASGFQLRHGEAISIGMAAETRLAERIGVCQHGLASKIESVLKQWKLPTQVPPDLELKAILQAMNVDKKRRDGGVRFSLPAQVGEMKIGVEVPDFAEALEEMLEAVG